MSSASFLARLTACVLIAGALAVAPAGAAVSWTKVYSGLTAPVDITHAGDGSGRLFLVQQSGQIRVVRNGVLLASPYLDLTGVITYSGEQGLLGLAFHPQFATNRQFYVNYTRASDGATVIARYTAPTAGSDVADPASAQILLTIAQPYTNHNGGSVKFGADGYLYIGMGDGGSGNDPEARAQDKTTLLGKILRIDVDHGAPYAIPPGNPYADGVGGRSEIFAIGLRNPWRISFDRATGDFWIGDVGQSAVEEIDLLPAGTGAGANLGWRVMEGNQCTGLSGPVACNDPSLTAPVITYTHSFGCAVTGGFMYRGQAVPSLAATYVYGDFCSGILWGARKNGSGQWIPVQLGDTTLGITGFGEDEAGELYFTDYNAGDIYRFLDTAPPVSPLLALSATSLDFGNVNVGTTSPVQTITVNNAGGGTLTLTSVTSKGGGASSGDFARGGTCAAGTALTGAQTCTVTFTLHPSQTGVRTTALTIASSGGNVMVPVTGTGVTAAPPSALSISATALDFGSIALGTSSATQTVTVSNASGKGGGMLTLSTLTPGGANPGDFARSGTCANGTSLAGAQACTVIYQFTPTATGARAANLAIASNGGAATLTVTGTGTATSGGPLLSASATQLNFGAVAVGSASATQTVTLTNSGSGTVTLASLTPGGANPGDFARSGTCTNGTSLTAAQSCTVVYQFSPTATGARAASLAIASNGGAVTLTVTGTGTPAAGGPLLNASATLLDFGLVKVGRTSAPQTITLTNAGSGTLTVASLTPGGANSAEFARTGTCAAGTNLGAAQTCTIVYSFAPTTFGFGSHSATLTIATNGGSATITLTGRSSLGF